jgi:hypothetical protein
MHSQLSCYREHSQNATARINFQKYLFKFILYKSYYKKLLFGSILGIANVKLITSKPFDFTRRLQFIYFKAKTKIIILKFH